MNALNTRPTSNKRFFLPTCRTFFRNSSDITAMMALKNISFFMFHQKGGTMRAFNPLSGCRQRVWFKAGHRCRLSFCDRFFCEAGAGDPDSGMDLGLGCCYCGGESGQSGLGLHANEADACAAHHRQQSHRAMSVSIAADDVLFGSAVYSPGGMCPCNDSGHPGRVLHRNRTQCRLEVNIPGRMRKSPPSAWDFFLTFPPFPLTISSEYGAATG